MYNKDIGSFYLISLVYGLEIDVNVIGQFDVLDIFSLCFYLLCMRACMIKLWYFVYQVASHLTLKRNRK